jgi:hypothetical protein
MPRSERYTYPNIARTQSASLRLHTVQSSAHLLWIINHLPASHCQPAASNPCLSVCTLNGVLLVAGRSLPLGRPVQSELDSLTELRSDR